MAYLQARPKEAWKVPEVSMVQESAKEYLWAEDRAQVQVRCVWQLDFT